MWSFTTYVNMDYSTRSLAIMGGLEMRLDGLDEWYMRMLAGVVRECATRKIKELEKQKELEQSAL